MIKNKAQSSNNKEELFEIIYNTILGIIIFIILFSIGGKI